MPQTSSYENAAQFVKKKFEAKFQDKKFNCGFNLENKIRNGIKFFVKNYENRFVILWFKCGLEEVSYQLYSRKALQKRLWHMVIEGFRKQDTPLFKNAVLLYAKIYKSSRLLHYPSPP